MNLKWAMSGAVTVCHFTLECFNADMTESLILTLSPNPLLWSERDMSSVELDQILPKTPQRSQLQPTAGFHTVTLIGSTGREKQPIAAHIQSPHSKHERRRSHRLLSESESPSIIIRQWRALCLTFSVLFYGYRWLFLFHQYTTQLLLVNSPLHKRVFSFSLLFCSLG